jgi:hypothetical protein
VLKLIRRVLVDPVTWATAVGTLIAVAIAGFIGWLWSESDFSRNGAAIKAGALKALSDLSNSLLAPACVARVAVWLVLVVSGALALTIAWLTWRTRGPRKIAVEFVSPPEKVPAPIEALDDKSRQALRYLLLAYPRTQTTRHVQGDLLTTFPIAEQILEKLAERDLIKYQHGMLMAVEIRVFLAVAAFTPSVIARAALADWLR